MALNQPMGESAEEPSYVKEMLLHPTNINLSLGAAVLGGALSFPLGFAGAAVVGIAYLAGEAIAAMYVPSSPTFRASVDKRRRTQRRNDVVADLSSEIRRREQGDDRNWSVLEHMRERIAFLREIAKNRDIPLTENDIERLEDSCVDYLGLWLSQLSMVDREQAADDVAVDRRLKDINERLDRQPERAERASLEKARGDLQEMLRRHQRLGTRRAAVEAALLSIPDAVEEIYHMVIAAPTSGAQADRLQDAINRLHLEETLEVTVNDELGDAMPRPALRAVAQSR
ncbi:MAG: hypothetical protein ABIQ70_04105 [Dokdonella sp.]